MIRNYMQVCVNFLFILIIFYLRIILVISLLHVFKGVLHKNVPDQNDEVLPLDGLHQVRLLWMYNISVRINYIWFCIRNKL